MKRLFALTAVMLLSSAMFFAVICAGADTRPSKGTWSGNNYIVGTCPVPAGAALSISVGKGYSTLTGASDWFSVTCTDLATGHGEGNAIITAANGDVLYLLISIDITGLSEPVGTWVQTSVVTGGTGRFADATGESTSNGTITPTGLTTFIWAGTHEGEISY